MLPRVSRGRHVQSLPGRPQGARHAGAGSAGWTDPFTLILLHINTTLLVTIYKMDGTEFLLLFHGRKEKLFGKKVL